MAHAATVFAKLLKAWKVACPIVTLTTSDPAAAVRQIAETLPGLILQWDCAVGCTVPAQSRHTEAKAGSEVLSSELDLAECLIKAGELKVDTALVIHNAHRFLDRPDVMQAVWNLRDKFKQPRRMLILLGPSLRVPVELQHDVIALDEPLPSHDELRSVIGKVCEAGKLEQNDEHLDAAATAATGMSAFGAEQLAALNMTRAEGLSSRGVWADKCRKIDDTPGLKVVSGGSFADVAGVANAKHFLGKILSGPRKPATIVFVDEIEKALGGASGDTSGVSQDQLGVLLQWMQDRRATGSIFVGPPGAAKSALAKAAGGESGVPTIQLDLGGMKGSLVGESETRIRDALKVIDAVSGGNTLWLATCNGIASLPPELRRRFKYGTFFFDLPSRQDREQIWQLYIDRFGLECVPEAVLAREWTGAEIESCCEIAERTGMSVQEAAEYIVPVSLSAADTIKRLRESADGRFLDAARPGIYSRQSHAEAEAVRCLEV